MATTSLISEQKSIVWMIPNFAQVLKSKELLKEQRFEFEMMCVGVHEKAVLLKWFCVLEEEGKDHIGIYFSVKKVSPTELNNPHARIHCQIPDTADIHNYFDNDFTFNIKTWFDAKTSHGFPKSLHQRPKTLPFLSTDGSLEIRVTVAVYQHSEVEAAELAAVQAACENLFTKNLRWEVTLLRKHPLNTSATSSTACKILSKEGHVLPSDRAILHARSPVFKAMFESGMREGQEGGVVEVKDIDSQPLVVLLHFLHSGRLARNWKEEGVIEGVVYGAHKYMLNDLKNFLDKVLGLVCTKGNCGKLMGLAKTFGLKIAEKRLFEYFRKNLANDMEQVASFVHDSDMAVMQLTSTSEEQQESGENDGEPQPKKSRLNEEDKLN